MSSNMSKARGDSVLKTLPDALQEELFQFLRRNTQANTLKWLKTAHDVETSAAALSEFFSWYPRSRYLLQAARASDELAEAVKNLPQLKLSAAEAREVAQASFEINAARGQDLETFAMLAAGEDKREKRQLAREKFEWSKKTDIEKGLTALHAEIEGDPEAERLYDAFAAHVRAKKKGGKK